MPNPRFALTSIAPEPEATGARVLTVWVGDKGGNIDVVLSEAEAIQLVAIFQKGFLDRTGKREVSPNYLSLTATGVDVAHGKETSGLLVQTAELGSIVLTFSPAISRALSHEIGRVDDANAARKASN